MTALRNRKAGIQQGLIHTPLDDILQKENDLLREELKENGDEENMTNPTDKTPVQPGNTPATFKPVAWVGLSKGGKALTLRFDNDATFFTIPRSGLEAVLKGEKKGVRVSEVVK